MIPYLQSNKRLRLQEVGLKPFWWKGPHLVLECSLSCSMRCTDHIKGTRAANTHRLCTCLFSIKCLRLEALQVWGFEILDCTCIWGKTCLHEKCFSFLCACLCGVCACACRCVEARGAFGSSLGPPQSLTALLLRQIKPWAHQVSCTSWPARPRSPFSALPALALQAGANMPGFSCQVLEIKLRLSGLCTEHFTDHVIFLAAIFWLWLVLWGQVWNFAPGHPCSRGLSFGSRMSNLYNYYVVCQVNVSSWPTSLCTKDALDCHNVLQKPGLKQQ